jgi:hypothetical protein
VMRVFLLGAFLALLACPASLADDAVKAGKPTKANLDLPFDTAASTENEEETGEAFVLYGQQYEGQGIFFCCGTGPLCST